MAKLTTQQRKNLAPSQFAIPSKAPGSGSYPIPDRSHAANALSRVSQFGSPTQKAAVRGKVHAKFPAMGQPPVMGGGMGDTQSVPEVAPGREALLRAARRAKGG